MNSKPIDVASLPELCTIDEVCAVLRIKKTLAYDLVKKGKIKKAPALMSLSDRLIRVPRSELERLVRGDAADIQLRRVK